MTSAEIKRVLSGIGISTTNTGYMQIPTLKYINLMTEGNQVFDKDTDFIQFDWDNELIKIKEKNAVLISGFMNTNNSKVDENTILMKYLPYVNRNFTFREYKVGDKVYYVNKKTSIRDASLDDEIVSIDGKTITLKNKIPSLLQYDMCYADPERFSSAVLDQSDNKMAFILTDRTKYEADIYISFDAVAGFSFISASSVLI